MSASVERLWAHAIKRAGTAVEADSPVPVLPKLKMRQLAYALLHFVELLEGRVPSEHRKQWDLELATAKEHLMEEGYTPSLNERLFQPIETTATWPNLAAAVRGAGLRALYAPGLANVAHRAVVSMAFSMLRADAATRARANEDIRVGLNRLEAGMWIALARSRMNEELAAQIKRAWWGAEQLALFELASDWCLVRMKPGRPLAFERGGRDDVLATVPDAHFTKAVTIVMQETAPR
ncbi:MAG: hypothetical protein QM817_05985 [Archangium sp.]